MNDRQPRKSIYVERLIPPHGGNRTELKLTNVARASLEELRLDYEDYLRQRGLEQWPSEAERISLHS